MLLLTQAEVERLLTVRECIDVMAEALATLARGGAILPLRTVLRLPDGSAAAVMPAYMDAPQSFGLKAITVFPKNEGTRYDSHLGVVLLFETEHGSPAALMDASSVTAIRTAAVSGVATRILARADAGDLAILGSGVQARTHVDAMVAVRPVRRVRVWSRSDENRRRFVDDVSRRHGLPVEAAASAREAVEGADIICTTTSSRQPVLEGEWIADGAHINAVGASLPTARELDSAAVARARLFVDRRESAVNEAGDYLVPRSEGLIGDEHIVAEIGELLTGRAAGRGSDAEVTLFKSLGLAVEDVAAAHFVYHKATAHGVGMRIELGGVH